VSGGQSGILQGDSTTVGIQTLMRRIISSNSMGSTYSRLSEVGLEQQTDGSLKLNTTKLTTAMGDMSNLQKLFTTDNANAATNGFALKLRDLAKGLIASDGTVSNKSTALQGAITRNGNDQDAITTRAAMVEKQLRAQYSALDAQMAKMSSLSSYVTAQLAQWNKTG
jgi:flagellar hook-associated protein 2